jgi:acyl-CoA reductase-like NAD-dependent aldehyde dehydrogenase
MPHIPLYRFGRPYESLSVHRLDGFRNCGVLAKLSQANAGLIRHDLRRVRPVFESLQQRSTAEMISICRDAGERFLNDELPLADGRTQSPADYRQAIAESCGLPLVMARSNMAKMHHVLTEMTSILKGLTRGLDLEILDRGIREQDELLLSFIPATTSLGVVLPSNSPGVNSLWLPAVALRIPVVLKPGREDPWTPWRLIQAFLAADCPPEAFGFYPTDHEGSDTVIEECGRAILFGDQSTVDRYADQPAVRCMARATARCWLAKTGLTTGRRCWTCSRIPSVLTAGEAA